MSMVRTIFPALRKLKLNLYSLVEKMDIEFYQAILDFLIPNVLQIGFDEKLNQDIRKVRRPPLHLSIQLTRH